MSIRVEGLEAGCLAVDCWQGYLVEVLSKGEEEWLQYEGDPEPTLHSTSWNVRVLRCMNTVHGGPSDQYKVGDEYAIECYYMKKVQVVVPDGLSVSCPWCQRRWLDRGAGYVLWAECPDCKGN